MYIYVYISEMELNVFANEEFASNTRSEGVAISSIISGIEDDAKLDVSISFGPVFHMK